MIFAFIMRAFAVGLCFCFSQQVEKEPALRLKDAPRPVAAITDSLERIKLLNQKLQLSKLEIVSTSSSSTVSTTIWRSVAGVRFLTRHRQSNEPFDSRQVPADHDAFVESASSLSKHLISLPEADFSKITPCVNVGVKGYVVPETLDAGSDILSRSLLLIPISAVGGCSLEEFIENHVIDYFPDDQSSDSIAGFEAKRFHFSVRSIDHGDRNEDVFLWISSRHPELILKYSTQTAYERGIAGREFEVTEVIECEPGVYLPKVVRQSGVVGSGMKKLFENTLMSIDFNPETANELSDFQLGFRFPAYLPVQYFEKPLSPTTQHALKTVIFANTNGEVLLETTEDAMWLSEWCAANNYPIDPQDRRLTTGGNSDDTKNTIVGVEDQGFKPQLFLWILIGTIALAVVYYVKRK